MSALVLIPLFFAVPLLLSRRGISRGLFLLFCFLIVTSFVVVYGLRSYSSGTDSTVYALAYESWTFYHWEVGYSLWLRFLKLFGGGYEMYFAIGTLVKLGLLAWSAYNVSKVAGYKLGLLFLALIVYSFTVFDLYTNGLRQGLAMTLAILSLSFYWRGRSKIALSLTFVTPAIHTAYWLFVVSFLVSVSLINRRQRITRMLAFISALSIGLLFFGPYVLDLVKPGLLDMVNYVGFSDNLAVYLGMDQGSFPVLNFNGKAKLVSLLLLTAAASLWLARSSDRIDRSLILLCSILVVVYCVFSAFAYSYRVLYFLSSLFPFLVVRVLMHLNKTRRYFRVRGVLATSCLFVVLVNYAYFVILQGGLLNFGYFIF